jgi:hypothetical protein
MSAAVKAIIKKTPLYTPLRALHRQIMKWRKIPPPPELKRAVLKDHAQKHGLKVFVETGTFLGDTVEALRGCVDQVYSIELAPALYEKARQRFKDAKNVQLIHGDSGKEIGALVPRLKGPALFWLDGHYCYGETAKGESDTPILQELEVILTSPEKRHVIIIDDARLFGRDPAYPSIKKLKQFVRAHRGDMRITIKWDAIRMVPRP